MRKVSRVMNICTKSSKKLRLLLRPYSEMRRPGRLGRFTIGRALAGKHVSSAREIVEATGQSPCRRMPNVKVLAISRDVSPASSIARA